jgi:hypothetical protein
MSTFPEIESETLSVEYGQVAVSRYAGLARSLTLDVVDSAGTFTGPFRARIALTEREAATVAAMLLKHTDIVAAAAAPRREHVVLPINEWLSANRTRGHWRKAAEHTDQVRRDMFYTLKKAGFAPFRRVILTMTPHGKSALRHDPGNLYPTVKAAVDALVDARLLPNDTAQYVEAVTMNKPQPSDRRIEFRMTSFRDGAQINGRRTRRPRPPTRGTSR